MLPQWLLAAAFAALLACLLVMALIRGFVLVPAISSASEYSVGISVFTIYSEARDYRRLCEKNETSLVWWRLWWAVHWLAVVAVATIGLGFALAAL